MPAAKDPMEADIMKKTLNKGKKALSILLALVLTLGRKRRGQMGRNLGHVSG